MEIKEGKQQIKARKQQGKKTYQGKKTTQYM